MEGKNIKKMGVVDRGFTTVKNSTIHGKGLFAKKKIPKGSRILEYAGKRVLKKNLIGDFDKGLTSLLYVMNFSETIAIDGEREGNNARFINHSCDPNCIVYYFDDIPYIYALREIEAEEELKFDYKMGPSIEEDIRQKYDIMPCFCGTKNCRGTLLYL
jgi:uncharacterized protein